MQGSSITSKREQITMNKLEKKLKRIQIKFNLVFWTNHYLCASHVRGVSQMYGFHPSLQDPR
jgi:hypothetical protein